MTTIEKLLQYLDGIIILVHSLFASLILLGLLMLFVPFSKSRRN